MNSNELINALIQDVINRFKNSRYPSMPLELTGPNGFELLIRVPPRIPTFINEKYSDPREKFAASPAIERIILPAEIRNQGFFSGLVNALGSLPSIEAVCVSNVTNPGFAQSLARSETWQEIESSVYRSSDPLVQHYAKMAKLTPSFYRRFPKD